MPIISSTCGNTISSAQSSSQSQQWWSACMCIHTLIKERFQQDWIEGESKKFDLLQKCRAGWKDPVVEPAQWPEPDISALLLSKSARLLTHRHLDNFLHPCLALELHENRKISQCDHVRSWVWIHSTASKTVYLSTQSELTLFPNWRNRRPWKLCFLVQQRLLSKKSVLAGWLCICLVYSVGWLVGCEFV